MSSKSPSDISQKNPAVDRLMEAIAPALSEELTRVLEDSRAEAQVRLKKALLDREAELREKHQAEANVQLKKALLDKGAELREQSEADQRRVRDETRVQVRGEVTAELEARFKIELATKLNELSDELEQKAQEAAENWKQERARLIDESERWHILADFTLRTAGATSQSEMLGRFLRTAERFSKGVALYLNKPDGLALWNTEGEAAAFPDLVSEDTKDPESYWVPIVVRSRTIAAVCATGVTEREPLDLLVNALKHSIEYLGLRIQVLGSDAVLNEAPEVSRGPAEPERPPQDSDEARSEARQVARNLVSAIKLENEKELLEGREHFDIYVRLQKAIEAGRETYRRRIPSPGPVHDYFHDEVVKILAEGDPSRLGEGYMSPR